MTKTETAKHFRSAREVELDAQAQAQKLADSTAAELEELARSMHAISDRMVEVMSKLARTAQAIQTDTKTTAQELKKTAESMQSTAGDWERGAMRVEKLFTGQSRRWLAVALLSAAVGAASASWLHHSWLASNNLTPPQVNLDVDKLANELVQKLLQLRRQAQQEQQNANAR